MFTVLIAEKQHIDAIKEDNQLFFEPFLENKKLAFCEWNPMGENLKDSLPDLFDVVGRVKNWRAIIINPVNGELIKARNPFDIVDPISLNSLTMPKWEPDSSANVDEWENEWKDYFNSLTKQKEEIYKKALSYPLVKLSTWLCYRPEDYILNDVSERKGVEDWALERIGRDEVKPSVKLEILEREQSKREIRLKEIIRKEFVADNYLNVTYPMELHCISIRTANSNFFDPSTYWNIHSDFEYSKFADRNMYFDKMRFMVFDLLPKTHKSYRTDYIRFLASVLVIATNPIPGSTMQARRLYQLDTQSDDSPLCTLVTSYDKKLAETALVIDNEIDKIRSEIPENLTDKEVEEIVSSPRDVDVEVDDVYDTDKIYSEYDFGLFYDYPENEDTKWDKHYSTSKEELEYLMRQQSRSIRKSVAQAKISSKIIDIDASRITPRLTSYQIDDIQDFTDNVENEMVNAIPPDFTNMERYEEELEESQNNVKKAIEHRMSKNTVLILSFVFICALMMSCIPFFIMNLKMFSATLSLIGTLCFSLFIVMIIKLFLLRRTLIKAIKEYNKTVRGIIEDVKQSMSNFSDYLSASCNVRRGYAVINDSKKNIDVYTKRIRIRIKHQEDIHKKRAILKEHYSDYFGDNRYVDKLMATPYDYDFDQKMEFAYPAPFLAGDYRQIEFFSAGNYVEVPSSYITSILVRMEGIYE